MAEDFESVADKKTNEIFTRWNCDECERVCEVACGGSDEPIFCPYGRENCEWHKLLLPIYITLEKEVVVGRMGDKKTNFEFKKSRCVIKDRKDARGRPFYDLYIDGKYENSYIDREKVEARKKELCG